MRSEDAVGVGAELVIAFGRAATSRTNDFNRQAPMRSLGSALAFEAASRIRSNTKKHRCMAQHSHRSDLGDNETIKFGTASRGAHHMPGTIRHRTRCM